MSRRGEIQVFSVSFLDVLSCALGGVLILLLMQMDASQDAASEAAEVAQNLQNELSRESNARQRSENELQNERDARRQAQDDLEDERKKREKAESAQAALVGLEGEMNGVVFIFDTSGSMDRSETAPQSKQFSDYQATLKHWLLNLDFKTFNVIDFDGRVDVWRNSQLVEASQQNRNAACNFVDQFVAEGGTYTLQALREAFELPGVDTIVLMSDGAPASGPMSDPTPGAMDDVHAFLRQANRSGRVTINTVGMGDYLNGAHGPFLQLIAKEHGGMFIGR